MYLSGLLFILIFFGYFGGISHSVFGGDSGDIILASWFGGVAHAPGYPLNTMIGWIFTHLPYVASVAYKANLMAAVLNAGVIVFLFLILKLLTKNSYVALASSLILAFNPLFWLYSHVIEVFQLNLLLVSICIYFLVFWRETILKKKAHKRLLYISFLFWGLATFHHQTSVLLAPAVAYFILKTDKKVLKNKYMLFKLFLFFCLGFLPYIFIPFAAARHTPINWDDPSNLSNFIRLITRADYGTFVAAGHFVDYNLKQRLSQLLLLFLFIKNDFTLFGLVLMLIGSIYCYLKEKTIFIFLLLAFIFTGPFFFFYSSFAINDDFLLGLWERFALLPYFFIAIFLAYGILILRNVVFALLKSTSKNHIRLSLMILFANVVVFILPFSLYYFNHDKTDLSNFYLGDWLGHDVLTSSEPNSIVFAIGDTSSFNSHYIYYTNESFRNRKLIKGGSLRDLYYRKQVVSQYPEINIPDNFLKDEKRQGADYIVTLANANFDKFPIYTSGFSPDIDGYKWFSVGLLKKLFKKDGENENSILALNESAFSRMEFRDEGISYGYSNFITDHVKDIYYYSFIDVSDTLISIGKTKESIFYLNKAINIYNSKKDAYLRFGNISFMEKDCDNSLKYFNNAYLIDKKDWQIPVAIALVYKECFKDQEKSDFFLKEADGIRGSPKNFKGL